MRSTMLGAIFSETAKYTSRFVIGTGNSADPPAKLGNFLNDVLSYANDELGLIAELNGGTKFYRGRLCESPHDIGANSDDLGPPPRDKAAANRMSPPGIGLFYAAGDAQTAVAEIAGHGVGPYAAVGVFTNTQKLRVLDFTRMPKEISPFKLDHRDSLRMARFLNRFVQEMTRPIIPDGRHHIDYVPTQLISEYLRWIPIPKLDGIALPSSHTGERIYVMFYGRSDCVTLHDETDQGDPIDENSAERSKKSVFVLNPADVEWYSVKREFSASRVKGPV